MDCQYFTLGHNFTYIYKHKNTNIVPINICLMIYAENSYFWLDFDHSTYQSWDSLFAVCLLVSINRIAFYRDNSNFFGIVEVRVNINLLHSV